MKRNLILALISLFFLTVSAKAQQASLAAWSGKGAKVANVGYGIGNIWKKLVFDNAFNFDKKKITATGPVAFGFEYGISKHIGIGLQAGIGQVKGVYTQVGVLAGGDYVETTTLDLFQILGRVNYHLGKHEKFDPYVGAGIGFVNSKLKTKNNTAASSLALGRYNAISPVGYTVAAGARYGFSKIFGAYAELGYVSGTFLQLGIVANL